MQKKNNNLYLCVRPTRTLDMGRKYEGREVRVRSPWGGWLNALQVKNEFGNLINVSINRFNKVK